MSVATQINRIQSAKAALKTAINAKTDDSHKITNETIDNYAEFVNSITTGGGGVSDRVKATIQALVERKCSYFEDFSYDNERYGIIDLAAFDDSVYRIRDIGQRAFNSFAASQEGNVARKIRIKMPKNLESISGANWHGAARVQYYDFSGYQGTTPPIYSSSTTNLGNSGAVVLVPNSLVDAWKVATGWASFADQIVGVEEAYN